MGRLRRSGSFGGRSAAPRRQIFNQAITGEVDAGVPVVGTVKVLGTIGVAIGEAPVTLVRTRGHWKIRPATFSGAVQIIRAALGLIVVSADAFAIGVTAMPGPIDNAENDWIVWSPLALSVPAAAITGQLSDADAVIDSRGMRKLKGGDVLAVVIDVVSDVAGGSFDISYLFRQQFKT